MVQEQAEQLQQCRTEEYRAAQSRSVRQSIIEEYGEDDVRPKHGDVPSARRDPLTQEEGDSVPSNRLGHGGTLPYPTMTSVRRKAHKWEEETPRDGAQATERGYGTTCGAGTGGVYFPRYQRPTSTSTPYESYGRGYTRQTGVPPSGPPGGGRQPPGVDPEEEAVVMTQMMMEMRKMKKRTLMSQTEIQEREQDGQMCPVGDTWCRHLEGPHQMIQAQMMVIRTLGSGGCTDGEAKGVG